MRVNFTTYDVRRGSDIIHPGTERCDVMLLAHEDGESSHQYWYARVLGIYHANVTVADGSLRGFERKEFALVRWFGRDEEDNGRSGLTRVGWDEENEYGFVDPQHILRACHIVPAFACEQAVARPAVRVDSRPDYNYYYVMR